MIATGFALAAQITTAFAEETEKKEAAPAPAEEAKKADVEVTLEGNDKLQFDKAEFTVKEGQTVALTFKNVGKLEKTVMGHNVVVLKKGTTVPTFAMSCMANAQTSGLPTDGELLEKVICLLYTSPSPRDATLSRMPSSA